jgi:exopolysaccharide production protein ExoQ
VRERIVWSLTVLALVGATRGPVYRVRLEMGTVRGDPIDDTRIQLIWCGVYALVVIVAWPAWRMVWSGARDLVWPLVAFNGALALSWVWSIQRERTVEQVAMLALGTVAAVLSGASLSPRRLAWAVWFAMTSCVAGSVWAHVRDWHYTVDPKGNFVGWYFNRNALGPVAALAVLSSVLLLSSGARGRWAVGLSAVTSAVVWFRTGSLTPLVAVVGAVAVALGARLWARGDASTRRRLTWIGSALPFVIVLALVARATITSWFGRSGTFSGRTELWSELLESWWHRPWGGYGFMAVWFDDDLRSRLLERGRDLYEAHSGYLEVLIGAGVPGVLALGWLLWASVRGVTRAVTSGSWESQWWVSAVVFTLIMSFGETFIGANIAAWLVVLAVATQARFPTSARADR